MKEESFPHTRKPLCGRRLRVAEGGSFGAMEESAATGVRRAKRRDSRTEARRRAALTSPREACLLMRRGGRGLGAEARASEVRSDRRERTGVGAPQLGGRESGKRSGAAEQARDFFLPLCFLVHEERGLRAPLKGAPEMGASRGYQRGPQRRV